MALDKVISSVRAEVAKRYDLKTNAEIDAFFLGMEESAKDNQEALEKRDKMLRDTVAELKELRSIIDACNILAVDAFAVEKLCKELKEAKRLLKAAVEDFRTLGTMLEDGYGHCTVGKCCDECLLGGGNLADDCQWRYEAETLKLIGEESETNG